MIDEIKGLLERLGNGAYISIRRMDEVPTGDPVVVVHSDEIGTLMAVALATEAKPLDDAFLIRLMTDMVAKMEERKREKQERNKN